MAQKTITANASISITANGTSTVNGSLTWTAPALPEGVSAWDSITVACDLYEWNGKGNFTLTINGHQCSSGASFSVALPSSAASPYTITGRGGNKNATGANCRFTNLHIEYVYTETSSHTLTVRYGATTIITDEVSGDVPVTYNGSTITTVASGQTKTLLCSGTVMASNVGINGKTLNCNGRYMENNVVVAVG